MICYDCCTHFFVLFYPLAYPYQDDNSVAAATADGGNPYSSPLLELFFAGVLLKSYMTIDELVSLCLCSCFVWKRAVCSVV